MTNKIQEPIVWLVQTHNQSRDFAPALKFGDIHPILGVDSRACITPGAVRYEIDKELFDSPGNKFNPELDFILWAGGDYLSMLLLGAVFQKRGINDFKFLRWERGSWNDGGAGYYLPVKVELFSKSKGRVVNYDR